MNGAYEMEWTVECRPLKWTVKVIPSSKPTLRYGKGKSIICRSFLEGKQLLISIAVLVCWRVFGRHRSVNDPLPVGAPCLQCLHSQNWFKGVFWPDLTRNPIYFSGWKHSFLLFSRIVFIYVCPLKHSMNVFVVVCLCSICCFCVFKHIRTTHW